MKKRLNRWRAAFTLVELIVALSIIVVLTMLSVPAFQPVIASRSVDSAARIIRGNLMLARNTAIAQRQRAICWLVEGSVYEGGEIVVTASEAITKTYYYDNDHAGFSMTGTWIQSTSIGNPTTCAPDSRYVDSTVSSDTKCKWTFTFPASDFGGGGAVTAKIWSAWKPHLNRSQQAPFYVHASQGSNTFTINQELGGGDWVPFPQSGDQAEFTFDTDTPYYVELCGHTGENDSLYSKVFADAIKIEASSIVVNPVIEFAASSLRSGSFGSLISVHTRRVSSFPSRIRDVGVIMDLGVHDIDVIRYLVNSPAIRVYAVSGKTKHPEFEDHANIVIEFENGVTGVIEVNWLTPMKVRMMSMTCIDRFVELDYVTQSVQMSYSELQEMDPEDLFHLGVEFHGKRITLKREEPLKRELADFIEAIDSGSGPLVTGFDAAKTLEIAHGSMISAAENRVVEL